jgi:uncharacterized membrane-anchored protein YjiN (DUF445 family)
MKIESDDTAAPAQPDRVAPIERSKRKKLQLVRMQRLATALLCTALVVLLVSARYESLWPWLRWVRAFAEASAIGAIADWYAVVALFGRPLGLPIPHTAIIPANQQSIGEGLGEFVAQYLLTPENIVGKLERYDTARQIASWLVVPENASRIATALVSAAPGLLRASDDADIRRFFGEHVAPKLLELNIARWAGRALQLVVETDLHRSALEGGLRLLDDWLVANEQLIRAKFAEASKYTPAPLDAYIVRKFLDAIHSLVHDVAVDPAHPLRGEAEQALRQFINRMNESPEYRETARNWSRRLIEHWKRDEDLQRMRNSLAAYVESDLAKDSSPLRQSATAVLSGAAQGVLQDRVVLDRLNGVWLKFVRTVTLQYRGQLSTLISDVLQSWDANEMGRKVSLEIGKDLQFIRINGALVGGIAGVALHAFTLLIG